MKKPLKYAQELVQTVVSAGDVVVDATCGNGHDTVFLAALVGTAGQVYAFDIQPQALAATKKKLLDSQLQAQVKLWEADHADIAFWPQAPLAAVMFNLGYLPGGDHALVTRAETTVRALQIAVARLKEDGVITLLVYRGHPGGEQEYQALLNYCQFLPQQNYAVLEYQFINQQHQPPLLLAISRLP